MKKQQSKKNKSSRRTSVDQTLDSQNQPLANSTPPAQQSFVQAKPTMEFSGPDLSGHWQTCGETVNLKRSSDGSHFEGSWGVHVLKFGMEGSEINKAHLGSMELMFGGSLSGPNEIQWGNGQVWTRS
jgi:hypothetical protein